MDVNYHMHSAESFEGEKICLLLMKLKSQKLYADRLPIFGLIADSFGQNETFPQISDRVVNVKLYLKTFCGLW